MMSLVFSRVQRQTLCQPAGEAIADLHGMRHGGHDSGTGEGRALLCSIFHDSSTIPSLADVHSVTQVTNSRCVASIRGA